MNISRVVIESENTISPTIAANRFMTNAEKWVWIKDDAGQIYLLAPYVTDFAFIDLEHFLYSRLLSSSLNFENQPILYRASMPEESIVRAYKDGYQVFTARTIEDFYEALSSEYTE
jgi:hypothetical protein